jgi:hypothetical protein
MRTSGKYKYPIRMAKASLIAHQYGPRRIFRLTHKLPMTKQGKAYGHPLKNSLLPPNHHGSLPYGCANSPPKKVPTTKPMPNAGERIEKIVARLEGWDNSAVQVFASTPVEFRPTEGVS